MDVPNLFKLEKLKIKAFSKQARTLADWENTFEAMFNPDSRKESYQIVYSKSQAINSSMERIDYVRTKSETLNVVLLLDGTGVDAMGIVRPFQMSVKERVKLFLDVCFRKNGDIHQPNFLILEWGTELAFSCRLDNVEITYTSFDRAGDPIRAEIDMNVISDMELEKRRRVDSEKSADVTHSRIVKAGDTLPLLSEEIYGSNDHYITIARANGLDDFRDLTPGRELVFPPLVN